MSILQDRKFLVHISVELVLVGSMAYFFHHRSKTLEERVKKVEEELITLTDTFQQEFNNIKISSLTPTNYRIKRVKF